MANPLYQKHIISINDLSREDLELVLATAAKLKANPQPELLKHKVIASCFLKRRPAPACRLRPPCTARVPAWSVSQTAATPRWAKRRNHGRYHLGHQHLCRCHRHAPPAGGCGASGDRVFRRYSGTQRRRRREPASDADPAGSVYHSGDPGSSGKS